MEFVRVNYPRARRVLLDGDDFAATNRIFRVERGTHSFAIDEPAEPPDITEFVELTSQQAPREFIFTPEPGFEALAAGTRSLARTRKTPAKAPPKKATRRKKRAAKPARRTPAKAKQAAKAKGPAKRPTKKRGRK